jgi:Tol biopolymer transport system component/DNA-binding winged helix-turn-helix (wHTH) protein
LYSLSARYRFGSYELDVEGRQVSRRGETLSLTPKTFDLLLALAEGQGRAMSRDELIRVLWSEAFVEEANLSFQISALRKALGDEGANYIETVPKHGYRFTCPLVRAEAPQAVPLPDRRRSPRRIFVAIALALSLIGVTWGITWLSLHRTLKQAERREASILPLTFYPGYEQQPSLSPDGSQFAFSWNGPNEDNYDIYVKLVGPGEPVRLTMDPASDQHPAWSPDGRYIAFLRFRGGTTASILLIPALGGAERKVADVKTMGFSPRGTRNLSWSASGEYLALGCLSDQNESASIWAIAVDTGERRRLTTTPPKFEDYSPVFSADDRSIAFIRAPRQNLANVYVQQLSKALTAVGEPRRVTFDGAIIQGLAWMPTQGKLIYSIARRFGFARLRVIDVRSRGFSRGREMIEPPFGEGATALSVSPGGRLVYARQFRDSNIWKVQVSGERTSMPTRILASTFDDHAPDYSADGKRIAFASTRSGFEEIWTAEVDGSRPLQLTNLRAPQTSNPRWSADGRKILFNSWDQRQSDLWTVSVSDGTLQRLTNDPENENESRWSRSGKWIYYSSDKSGRYEIYKMPAEGGAGVPVTREGGINPNESHDGLLLYYAKTLSSPNEIWRVRVTGGKEERVVDGLSNSLNFALADKGIYFLSVGVREAETALEFYEFKTGKRKGLRAVGKPWFYGMAMSPQQNSICYSIVDHAGSNLMLVDGMK